MRLVREEPLRLGRIIHEASEAEPSGGASGNLAAASGWQLLSYWTLLR